MHDEESIKLGTEILTKTLRRMKLRNDLDDFKKQLPDNAKVMIEDEIKDERGTRFLLIGKYE